MTDVSILSPSIWPGTDPVVANQVVLGVIADPPSGVGSLPGLLVLPHRGPAAAPIGRTLAVVESMPVSLEPHGWRLAGRPSVEQRRARHTLDGDIEQFALGLAGFPGPVQVPVVGPFSLAAALWLRVGERAIADPSARDDVVASLALGLTRLLDQLAFARDLPALLPGVSEVPPGVSGPPHGLSEAPPADRPAAAAQILLQEPWLPKILAGTMPTFSGRGSLPALRPDTIADGLRALAAALHPHELVLQIPPDVAAFDWIRSTGAVSLEHPLTLQLDATQLDKRGWERLAELLEAGVALRWRSVPIPHPGEPRPDPREVATRMLRHLREVGLRPAALPIAVAPGLADGGPVAAQASLALLSRTAVALGDLVAT